MNQNNNNNNNHSSSNNNNKHKNKNKTILIPILLIAVVFIALGFIQILFQRDVQIAINQSQANFEKMVQTQIIINHTLNDIGIVGNETRALAIFLSNNFGENSGYLEKENFQYQQANQTAKWLNQSLQNQQKIMSILNTTR